MSHYILPVALGFSLAANLALVIAFLAARGPVELDDDIYRFPFRRESDRETGGGS